MSGRTIVGLGVGVVAGVVSVCLLQGVNAGTDGLSPTAQGTATACGCQPHADAAVAARGESAGCSSGCQQSSASPGNVPPAVAAHKTKLVAFDEAEQGTDVDVVVEEFEEEVIVSTPGVGHDAYIARKETFEAMWTEKIDKLLSYVPGAVVVVNVDLGNLAHHEEHIIEFDPKPVPIETVTATRTHKTTGGSQSAHPGNAAEGGPTATTASSKSQSSQSEMEETEETIRREVSRREVTRAEVPLVPDGVSASIAIPSSYITDVWHNRNPIVEGAELTQPTVAEREKIRLEMTQRFENAVVTLLPPASHRSNSIPRVTVTFFENLGTPSTLGPSHQQPPSRDTVARRSAATGAR